MNMNIDRFDIWADERRIVKDFEDDGVWVLYDDHKDIVDHLLAENRKLRDKLETDLDDCK